MALKTTICVVVYHAGRTRAHSPTMVLRFELSSGAVCLPKFGRFHDCNNASGRSPQIVDLSLGYECKLHPVVSLSTDKSG